MVYLNCPKEKGQRKKLIGVAAVKAAERRFIMAIEKFCTRCGRKFIATGREVICPECKAAAAEESKKAAVLKAKRASWTGESVPVRISGRASTVIREFGAAHNVPFAEALDELLKSTDCFKSMSTKWENITPYKSRRRDKSTTEDAPQDKPQDAPQEVTKAAKTSKPQTAKKAVKTTSKPQAANKAVKAAGKGGKA